MDEGDKFLNQKRIWVVLKYYYPNFSGMSVAAQRIFSRMVQLGYAVHILTQAKNLAAPLVGQTNLHDGVNVHYLKASSKVNLEPLRRIPFLWKLVFYGSGVFNDYVFNRQVLRLVQTQGASRDALLIYSIDPFVYLLEQSARRQGIGSAVIMTLLGSDDPQAVLKNTPIELRSMKMRGFEQAQVLVALCSAQMESCEEAGLPRERLVRIPTAVDTDSFRPVQDETERRQTRQTLGLPEDRRYIVFVGAALERKGIDVLIEAFLRLAPDQQDVDLLVIGEYDFSDYRRHPQERQALIRSLQDRAAAAGVASRIHWVGMTQEVQRYLQAADIFCFPSRREGFGTVTVEAMATGLPVVVARLEGVTTDQIEEEQSGLLIRGHNPQDYTAALSLLLTNPDQMRRMGAAARQRALKLYGVEQISAQYEALYQVLSSGKPTI